MLSERWLASAISLGTGNWAVVNTTAERVAMLGLRRRLALGGKDRRHEHSYDLGHEHLLHLLRTLLVVRRLRVGRAPHGRAAHHRRRRCGRRAGRR